MPGVEDDASQAAREDQSGQAPLVGRKKKNILDSVSAQKALYALLCAKNGISIALSVDVEMLEEQKPPPAATIELSDTPGSSDDDDEDQDLTFVSESVDLTATTSDGARRRRIPGHRRPTSTATVYLDDDDHQEEPTPTSADNRFRDPDFVLDREDQLLYDRAKKIKRRKTATHTSVGH